MYLLIVYNDFQRNKICGLFKFKFIKDVIKWSNKVITYSDINSTHTTYKTFKRLFQIIKLK